MENRNKYTRGYLDLSRDEIAILDEGRVLANQVDAWLEKLQASSALNQSYVATGKDYLQKGFKLAFRGTITPASF